MTSATANTATIALKGAAVSISTTPNQELSERKSEERADHVDREDPPALCRPGFSIEPALGGDEESAASEANDRAQQQPGQWSAPERHRRGCGDDHSGEGGVGTDVTDPLDDPSAAQRSQG